MRIGGFQKVSFIDFPEHIASIVFAQGCPWRCQFCHNPSLVRPECFGTPIDESVIWDYLKERKGKIDGVVITGGEPTLQPDLPEFIEKIRMLGYAVKLDTGGAFPDRLKPILDARIVDYIAMDLKADWAHYAEVIGAPADIPALKYSMELIRNSGVPYEWRTTVVPQLPIDPIAIGKNLRPGERYFLQYFRKTEGVANQSLTQSPTPLSKGVVLKPLEEMGLEVAWR